MTVCRTGAAAPTSNNTSTSYTPYSSNPRTPGTPGSAGGQVAAPQACGVAAAPASRMHDLFADMYRQSDYQQQNTRFNPNPNNRNVNQPTAQQVSRRPTGQTHTPYMANGNMSNGGITRINNETIGPFYPANNGNDANDNDVMGATKHDASFNSSADSGFSPGPYKVGSPTYGNAPASMSSSISELSDASYTQPAESQNTQHQTSFDAFPTPPPPLNNEQPMFSPKSPGTALPTPPPALPTCQAPVWKPTTPSSADSSSFEVKKSLCAYTQQLARAFVGVLYFASL